jgi:hypothetical protein
VRLRPDLAAWLFYAHCSAEPGHRQVLEALEAKPLLDLGMRLGEGSGAAVAAPILRAAAALHAGMATFRRSGSFNGMSDFTTVDLLRHGEPEGGQKFRGALDDPLSSLGWEQLRTTVGDYRDWQAIVSSPLIRCAAFAKELAERLDRPLEIMPDFRELNFGAWEGRTSAEVYAADPLASGAILARPGGASDSRRRTGQRF